MTEITYSEILDILPDLTGKDLKPDDGLVLYAASVVIRDEKADNRAVIMEAARQGDPFCFKVMDDVLRFYVAKEIPLTGDLMAYAADRDNLKPRGGKTMNTNFLRNLIIQDAVAALRRESVSENSATDIISRELSKRGYDVGHQAVRTIIKNSKSTR